MCVFNRRCSKTINARASNFLFFLVLFSLSFGSNDGAPPDFTIQNDENPQRRKRARISPLVDTRNTETLKIRAHVHRKIPSERVRAKKSFKIGSRIACRSIAKENASSEEKNALTEREGEMSSFISLSPSVYLSARDKKTHAYISPGISRIRINILSTPTHAFAPRRVPVPSSSSSRTRRVPSSFASTHR